MNPAIEKLEKKIFDVRAFEATCNSQGATNAGIAYNERALELESLKASVEALEKIDGIQKRIDTAINAGQYFIPRKLLNEAEISAKAALTLFNRAMGVSHE